MGSFLFISFLLCRIEVYIPDQYQLTASLYRDRCFTGTVILICCHKDAWS